MLKKLLRIIAAFVLVVCVAGVGLVAYAARAVASRQNVPFPAIAADRTPAGVARGAVIFHATCEACHRGAESERAAGAPIHDAPDWFGSLHSGNITADRAAGIGGISDAAAARMIRYGVNRDGRWGPMPTYSLSDADLAAVIGFLRSDDPLFRADPRRAPKSELSFAGKTILFLTGATQPPNRPPRGIVAPPREPNAAYGRYLAESVYQCGDCHTPGFDSDKVHGPDAFAGGAEMKNAAGELILSPNLTKDERAGIGRWTREQFARAIRDGIRPDGRALGYPMPHFRGADELEVDALLQYLRSFPAKATAIPGRVPAIGAGSTSTSATAPTTASSPRPEQRFAALGCAGCHGKGSRYEAKLQQAQQKPAEQLARWIRNPEAFLPGTTMPTFAPVLDEVGALELAEWIRAGGPNRASFGGG
ncbi:MAG TPA: c-type cytochrome [Polyangiaceae bacterium]|nr:c-type cytochrome [Polyangiaceae bacterium]